LWPLYRDPAVTILETLIATVLLVWLYAAIIAQWRLGFLLLMLYLPFAGAVSLALHLWAPSLLFKDVLFITPTYIAFGYQACAHKGIAERFPHSIVVLALCLAVLVVAQMLNPGVANSMMALIGLKIWLLYIPLALVAYAYLDSCYRFLRFCRMMILPSFIPSAVALLQVTMVKSFGYRAAMELSYGDMATRTTQLFSASQFESALFGRVPSIFTFAPQFFGFSLAMLVPSYIVWRTDLSARWRRVGATAFITSAVSTFLSGERASFIFTPLAIAIIFLLDRGLRGFLQGLGLGIFGAWSALSLAFGIGIGTMYSLVGDLFFHYGSDVAYGGLVQALQMAPLGLGTGTNTGAARYSLTDPDSFVTIENYYAKATYELGLPGLLIVAGLLTAILVIGLQVRGAMRSSMLRCWAGTLLAFVLVIQLNSFKGWLIDLDPVNVYFWVFCGLMLKLPMLQSRQIARY
jgi:hypothetical protein